MSKDYAIIAAGGTGGHIYPALSIAEALKKKDPELELLFVGTAHGLENEIIPKRGYKLLHLPIGRLHRSVGTKERITTVLLLPWAIIKAISYCLKYKPVFLLGVGGHASGPMLLAGSLLRYYTVIWEPNAMPGLANRILSKFVDHGVVIYDRARELLQLKNSSQIGYPVRESIEQLAASTQANQVGLSEKLKVLVFMGSLGAKSLNELLPELYRTEVVTSEKIDMIHQTGLKNFETTMAKYEELGVSGKNSVVPYIDDVESKLSWADVVICRSGAGTLSEVAAAGKPCVLIPFPYSSDDHQKKNAQIFADKGAGVLIEEKDLSAELLFNTLIDLKADPKKRLDMGKAAFQLHIPHSADKIAQLLLEDVE